MLRLSVAGETGRFPVQVRESIDSSDSTLSLLVARVVYVRAPYSSPYELASYEIKKHLSRKIKRLQNHFYVSDYTGLTF